jgi:peptidyl-prolyl cis-trans isomerase A (cyclophilin A)
MNPKTGKAESGTPYFNGIQFHRVIPGFMIQGGDPTASGTGGPGYMFNNEIWQGNAIEPGVLAMANTGRDGTNGSQFFIMRGRREDLDKLHTVFGKCNELDLIDKIAGVPTGAAERDKPNDPVTITNVTITKG